MRVNAQRNFGALVPELCRNIGQRFAGQKHLAGIGMPQIMRGSFPDFGIFQCPEPATPSEIRVLERLASLPAENPVG